MAPKQTNVDAPLILDSALQAVDKMMYIKKIRWVGSTAVGNELKLSNYHSTAILFHAYANGSFADIESDFSGLVGGCLRSDGVKLTTRGAGDVYIYHAP